MPSPQIITFFLCDGMLGTSVSLPLEQFEAARSLDVASKRTVGGKVKLLLASIDGRPVTTNTGMILPADCAIADVQHSHITYLPALWRNPIPALKRNRDVLPWLKTQRDVGGTIAGVGTGCCFMAEAGILDGRVATTHWYYFDQFAKAYPKVSLKRDHFITRSDNLFCAASVNALADLTVFFIQEIFNADIARHIERHFFHEVRTAFTLDDNPQSQLQAHPDEDIAEAQSLLKQNLHTGIEINALASRLKMSLRTFNRRFKAATNRTPTQYIQSLRMRTAAELLKTSNLSVGEIAFRCGHQDAAHFSSLFKKHFGATPSQYRTTVRAKLFNVE